LEKEQRCHLASSLPYDVDEHDWQENELSLREGFRLLSAYHTDTGLKFWVITEADRSATTVLLPDGAP
jgi:hypothetical protein